MTIALILSKLQIYLGLCHSSHGCGPAHTGDSMFKSSVLEATLATCLPLEQINECKSTAHAALDAIPAGMHCCVLSTSTIPAIMI